MKTACIQLCCGGDIPANIKQAEMLIRAAHKDGARIIATPENTNLMQSGRQELFAKISYEGECEDLLRFKALANELEINLLIGSLAVKFSENKAANRSFLIGRDGVIKARYDKMHLFDVDINKTETWRESDTYTAGKMPVLTHVNGMGVGMSICYDLRFASLYKHYAKNGAHILTIPAAFTAVTGEAHWRTLLRARAIETSCYVVAPAQGGRHDNGRVTWGHSMIIDPWGKVVAELGNDQLGYCIADISKQIVTDVRKKIPAWHMDRFLP